MQRKNIKRNFNILAVIIIAAGLLLTSLAYFTASDEKLNTFTIGNLAISLEEPLFEELDDSEKVLLPGTNIPKDPTVTVAAKSEDSYVFMLVNTKIMELFDEFTVTDQWLEVTGLHEDGLFKMMYVYVGDQDEAKVVSHSNVDQVLAPLFTELIVKTTLDNEDFVELTDISLTVKAFAHQAKVNGVYNYIVAKDAAYAHFFD